MSVAAKQAQIFKVLSVETRIRMIELLKRRSLCVNALAHTLKITPAAVSQHLRILRDAEIVIAEKRGYFVHYRVNDETLAQWNNTAKSLLEMEKQPDKVETCLVNPFDAIAENYDRWYEIPEGKTIFNAELKCLRSLQDTPQGRWLEVGVGTGRFAYSLGIVEGIDPSPRMLDLATGRGIRTYVGSAERLPFADGSFDGILMALTLCFVADARQALGECWRVLRPKGRLLLGIVPLDSPWGEEYIEKASKGHPVYALAHFRTVENILELAENNGFKLIDVASTLFWAPGEEPEPEPHIEGNLVPGAGFVCLLFDKKARPMSSNRDAEDGN